MSVAWPTKSRYTPTTMRLYFMRHGEAVSHNDPACPADSERFLTDQGIRHTTEAAQGLGTLGLTFDTIFSSPYLRARQTADICASHVNYDNDRIESMEPLVPDGDPIEVFSRLALIGGGHVLCITHLPCMDYIIAVAVGAQFTFTHLLENTLAVIDMPTPRPGDGTLVALYQPATLRMLGGQP